ncbi:unnamed protein product [Triticum turgidum subsp. durum]|uniref:Urease accessory protein UreH-like transmembrane domain-containing protein n=1 Tax=Triticum turgidum subsp. durum TaxID=4567 RepID=A0A9R0SP63_TRITD|nr:unnamed protein product [Triticum turgidum subsp. durum]
MDRLISSPLHLTRAPASSSAASRPRAGGHHHLLPAAAAPRSFAPLHGLGLHPLAPLLPRPPLPLLAAASASSRADAVNPAPPEQDDEAAVQAPPNGFTRFFQKVASAAAVALVAALVVAAVGSSSMVPPALASALHGHSHTAVVTAGRSIFKSELLGSAWTGFLAGCLHTLSGPDHLAALAPLSIGRSPVESAAVGALWGCGHDAGQVMFGLLFLGLKDRLHIEVLRTWGTRVVGLTLLVIGAIGIREATQAAPCVAAALEGGAHQHGGNNSNALEKALLGAGGKKKEISFATFATGIVHGLQPDALMIILPALAMPSRAAGAAFLGMFLVGTVLSMASYTVLIGTCTEALKERVPRITEKLTWAASLVAISMGVAIIVSESFGVSLY